MIVNNAISAIDFSEVKLTRYTLNMIYEWASESLSCRFYEQIVFSGLKMPEEFYSGVREANRDIWSDIVIGNFDESDSDDTISLDEIVAKLYLDKTPKTLEEITATFQDFLLKREYHEHLFWFKWSAIECEEIKSQYHFRNPVDTNSAREWAIEIIEEYGLNYLHIEDFFEFGYLYGQFDWLNRLRYYLERPEEFDDE